MYHCHLHLYFVGQQQQLFETLKAMEPLENFGHTFLESSAPDQALTAQADLILAALEGMDAEEAVAELLRHKREEAELIVLGSQEQTAHLPLSQLQDIWTAPLAAAMQAGQGPLADQPLSGGHHQQYPQPDLV